MSGDQPAPRPPTGRTGHGDIPSGGWRQVAPTPADDLARQAAGTPSATALTWEGGRLTYRQLDSRVTSMADLLSARGAVSGEAVTLCPAPGPQAVAALFGLWRAGCVAVPLHERITPSEVDHARQIVMSALHIDNASLHQVFGPSLAGDARGARVGFGTGGVKARGAAGGVRGGARFGAGGAEERSPAKGVRGGARFGAGGAKKRGAARGVPGGTPSGAEGAGKRGRYLGFPDVNLLILTSGSSGPPRAFGFTRDTLAASAAAVAQRLCLTAGDRWGLCLSPGHIGGLSLLVRAVMTGSSVRLWPSFDAGAVADAMLSGKVTHLAVVPVMLRNILARLAGRRPPETLRCVLVGGSAAPRALLDRAWEGGLPVATTWGMTETASQVATAPPKLARLHPGTAGRPLRGVEVRRDPGGVLHVRGPTLASMVVHGPGAPPQPLSTDPDGWFATRDLGRVDPDGLVRIEGRADAMIVSGGLNVSPAEVERVIGALPGVRDAVVLGLPDEEWGEVVVAVVEGDPSEVTAGDVDRHCRERLVRGRCPTRTLVVDALPRTRTGKVMRWRVGERYGPELRRGNGT